MLFDHEDSLLGCWRGQGSHELVIVELVIVELATLCVKTFESNW